MTKAKRAMKEDIKLVDLIIELTDARAPLATRNPDIDDLGKNKARIIILNKSDMADEKLNRAWNKYFTSLGYQCVMMDSRSRNSLKELISSIDIACIAKRERDKKRGILSRPIRAMVAGIPNVGKSTLINTIAGKSTAKTGNKPGVTKGNQWIKMNKAVELLDTPGILWPRFDDNNIGLLNAFIGSINDMVIDTKELALELIAWIKKHNPDMLDKKYESAGMDEHQTLEQIAKLNGCLQRGNEYDFERAATMLINDFRSGRLGRITLESPPELPEKSKEDN